MKSRLEACRSCRRERPNVTVSPGRGFADALAASYQQRLSQEVLMVNELYLSFVYRPLVGVATGLMAVLSALRVERLLRANFIETQILNNIAERDGLSGLYNRRMFDKLASRLWQQAQRDQQPLQVILVDIDHFKLFNDHYGHQAGDHCIRQVATIIARAADAGGRAAG
jgi:PleD family two-component response regulator